MPLHPSRWPQALILAVALVSGVASSPGQVALCVENHGKLEVVRRATGRTAFVQEGGKWVDYRDGPFVLQPVAEYVPLQIAVRNRSFQKGARALSDNGPSSVQLVKSGRFVFKADFTAPIDLENVFIVLELGGSKPEDKMLFVHGLGHLNAHQSSHVSLDEVTPFRLMDIGLKRMRVFVDGHEVFHSMMPASERSAALDKIVSARLKKTESADAPVAPLFTPAPAFPAKTPARAKTTITVVTTVDAHGETHDPSIAGNVDAVFAGAALETVKQWRFMPQVKDGKPIEAKINVPVVFDPAD